ncbi:MAG TPA: SDR family oxidoreductase [Polyangiaceae bacterium]|nr:SDR family oxidoreductase [Polyangiaceae bacterium]
MSIYGWLAPRGPSGYGYGSTAEQVTAGLDLTGKSFLVTGCTSGLGAEAMRVLALRGARVLGTARTVEKAQEACGDGRGALGLSCELSDPASVRACAQAVKQAGVRLDGIICNAGVMAYPELRTHHGYEAQFFSNHIGHFILVTHLLDLLVEQGRVVMLSSSAHFMAPKVGIEFDNLDGKKSYNSWKAYGQSKLANLLFAKELSRRFQGSRRTANAVHPGVINTGLQRHMNPVLAGTMTLMGPVALKNVAQGAATEVYAATHPGLADVSGKYFANCNVAQSSPISHDAALAQKLWTVSEEIVSRVLA